MYINIATGYKRLIWRSSFVIKPVGVNIHIRIGMCTLDINICTLDVQSTTGIDITGYLHVVAVSGICVSVQSHITTRGYVSAKVNAVDYVNVQGCTGL